jgi:pilus assembly protein CpaB
MIKRRGLVLIMVSFLLALGAAWVAKNWLQVGLRASTPAADPGMQVVVAAIEIPFGTKLETRHVKTIKLPRGAEVGNHFEKPDDVIGLLATQKMIPGEIILKERLADRAAGSTLAAVLKPDMRAMTVRVDDVVGVAGFLLPGNRVDVVAARMVNQRAETQTVLRNLNVLAVDQTASQDKDQPVVVRAVTLEVTPEQAEVLVKAREEGRIQLTLRNPNDSSDAFVVETPTPKPPVKKVRRESAPAPAKEAVTIIRGTNVHNADSKT